MIKRKSRLWKTYQIIDRFLVKKTESSVLTTSFPQINDIFIEQLLTHVNLCKTINISYNHPTIILSIPLYEPRDHSQYDKDILYVSVLPFKTVSEWDLLFRQQNLRVLTKCITMFEYLTWLNNNVLNTIDLDTIMLNYLTYLEAYYQSGNCEVIMKFSSNQSITNFEANAKSQLNMYTFTKTSNISGFIVAKNHQDVNFTYPSITQNTLLSLSSLSPSFLSPSTINETHSFMQDSLNLTNTFDMDINESKISRNVPKSSALINSSTVKDLLKFGNDGNMDENIDYNPHKNQQPSSFGYKYDEHKLSEFVSYPNLEGETSSNSYNVDLLEEEQRQNIVETDDEFNHMKYSSDIYNRFLKYNIYDYLPLSPEVFLNTETTWLTKLGYTSDNIKLLAKNLFDCNTIRTFNSFPKDNLYIILRYEFMVLETINSEHIVDLNLERIFNIKDPYFFDKHRFFWSSWIFRYTIIYLPLIYDIKSGDNLQYRKTHAHEMTLLYKNCVLTVAQIFLPIGIDLINDVMTPDDRHESTDDQYINNISQIIHDMNFTLKIQTSHYWIHYDIIYDFTAKQKMINFLMKYRSILFSFGSINDCKESVNQSCSDYVAGSDVNMLLLNYYHQFFEEFNNTFVEYISRVNILDGTVTDYRISDNLSMYGSQETQMIILCCILAPSLNFATLSNYDLGYAFDYALCLWNYMNKTKLSVDNRSYTFGTILKSQDIVNLRIQEDFKTLLNQEDLMNAYTKLSVGEWARLKLNPMSTDVVVYFDDDRIGKLLFSVTNSYYYCVNEQLIDWVTHIQIDVYMDHNDFQIYLTNEYFNGKTSKLINIICDFVFKLYEARYTYPLMYEE